MADTVEVFWLDSITVCERTAVIHILLRGLTKSPRNYLGIALVVALLGGLATPAGAHHSAAPHFDLEKTITLTATLTQFKFVNPHAYVYFSVVGPDGKTTPWRCELPAATALGRLGWTLDIFPIGQTITIKGAPARREDNVCMLTSFIRADGVEIDRNADVAKLRPATTTTTTLATAAVERPARLADGQINLKGPWVAAFGPGGRGRGAGGRGGAGRGGPPGGEPGGPGRGGPGGPGRPEPTSAGELAGQQYDQRFDDPAIKCSPANILFGWTHDQHVNEITQKGKEITLQYGYMDFVRTVHLNAAHPKTIKPSTGGHSTGTWDGDVLVVDTIGIAPGVLIPISGLMHSGQIHVVERFTVDPVAKTLTRAYQADDALYLKSTYTGSDVMNYSTEPFGRYNCVELSGKNNVRPK